MDRLPLIVSGFAGIASQILQDRLELLALELREAKIRFVQAVLLVCTAVVFSLLGLLLLILAALYILPPEWRLYGLTIAAVASMLAGTATFIVLCRHLARKPLAFEQSLAELKKDTTCFSTKN